MCQFVFFFFSSRRRHTRCALVTGVQTCALPIYTAGHLGGLVRQARLARSWTQQVLAAALAEDAVLAIQGAIVIARSLDDNAVFDQIGRASGRERVCQYV